MKKGLIRIPPLSNRMRAFSSVVGNPPLPLPMTTPSLSGSSSDRLSLESSTARAAAATAIWEKRAIRRASLGLTYWAPSKPVTSPAIWHG